MNTLFQSHTRNRAGQILVQNIGFKNSNLLSALHLYLDEGSLHPIFCLIHLLHRIQPQPLQEMITMMMMMITMASTSLYTA